MGYLKNKTRIVATHSLAYLPYFDRVVLMEEGRIVEQGTYAEVSSSEAFVRLQGILQHENTDHQASQTPTDPDDDLQAEATGSPQLNSPILSNHNSGTKVDQLIEGIISAEDKARGRVITLEVLATYCKFLGGKRIVILAILGSIISRSSVSMGRLRSPIYMAAPVLGN